jgi:hypothetical protein
MNETGCYKIKAFEKAMPTVNYFDIFYDILNRIKKIVQIDYQNGHRICLFFNIQRGGLYADR